MVDISTLIAQGPGRVDFSALGDLGKSYWEGLNQAHAQKQRDLFQGGVPSDIGQAIKMAVQAGGGPALKEFMPSINMQAGIGAANRLSSVFNQSQDGGASTVVSPSTSRTTPMLPDSETAPQGMQTLNGLVLRATGGKEDRTAVDEIAQRYGLHPDAPLDPEGFGKVVPELRQRYGRVPAVQLPQQAQAAPQAPQGLPNPSAPVSPAASPQADPTLGGVVPPYFRGNYQVAMDFFSKAATYLSSLGNKEGAKVMQDRADIIGKAIGQLRESALKERSSGIEKAVGGAIEDVRESRKKADSFADGIVVSHDLIDQLNNKGGIFSGQWANQRLALAKTAAQISGSVGFKIDTERITNTESFMSLVGKKVAQTVKSFGSGTSITNQDREYAAKMEAGDIRLDEKSMRRILILTDKINRDNMIKHNEKVDELVTARPEMQQFAKSLKVSIPPTYGQARGFAEPKNAAEAKGYKPGTKYMTPDGDLFVR